MLGFMTALFLLIVIFASKGLVLVALWWFAVFVATAVGPVEIVLLAVTLLVGIHKVLSL